MDATRAAEAKIIAFTNAQRLIPAAPGRKCIGIQSQNHPVDKPDWFFFDTGELILFESGAGREPSPLPEPLPFFLKIVSKPSRITPISVRP